MSIFHFFFFDFYLKMYLNVVWLVYIFKLEKEGTYETYTHTMKITMMRFWILAITMLAGIPVYSQVVVWPGDANNDGVVNTLDVLYLGVGFNTQGPARLDQGIIWQPDSASLWNNVLPDSTNYVFLDCNGNGFIDINDLVAIEQNFGLTHQPIRVDSFPAPDSLTSPLFYFVGFPDSLQAGDTVSIEVFAGSNIMPADFFGLALTFSYDTLLIVPNSVMASPDSLISAPVDPAIFFTATDSATQNLEIALTKRANSGGSQGVPFSVAGDKLFTISFIIEDNLIGKAVAGPLEISLSNIRMYSKNLVKSSGVGTEISIPFKGLGTSIKPLELNSLRIYPQPANHLLVVDGLPEKGQLLLTDLSGKTLVAQPIESLGPKYIDCSMLPAGMYLLHINTAQGTAVKKVLID